eukprot:2285497-Rhodomonas_salina.2
MRPEVYRGTAARSLVLRARVAVQQVQEAAMGVLVHGMVGGEEEAVEAGKLLRYAPTLSSYACAMRSPVLGWAMPRSALCESRY